MCNSEEHRFYKRCVVELGSSVSFLYTHRVVGALAARGWQPSTWPLCDSDSDSDNPILLPHRTSQNKL